MFPRFRPVTSPTPDLSRLRINRDAPPPALRRALIRNVVLGLVALALVLGAVFAMRTRRRRPGPGRHGQPDRGSEGGGPGAGVASVTANGYVVARTRASVSAKLAGRLADLGVSEGSNVKRGEVIARLDNADYQAQAAQAEAAPRHRPSRPGRGAGGARACSRGRRRGCAASGRERGAGRRAGARRRRRAARPRRRRGRDAAARAGRRPRRPACASPERTSRTRSSARRSRAPCCARMPRSARSWRRRSAAASRAARS